MDSQSLLRKTEATYDLLGTLVQELHNGGVASDHLLPHVVLAYSELAKVLEKLRRIQGST